MRQSFTIILVAAILYAFGSLSQYAIADEEEKQPISTLPLVLSSGGQYAVVADISGVDALLAIDTAASASGLTLSYLNQLDLEVTGQAQVFGATGPVSVDLYDLGTLRLGPLEINGLQVPALPDFSMDLDGVIGVDVLRPYAVAFRPESGPQSGVVELFDTTPIPSQSDEWAQVEMTTLPFGFSFVETVIGTYPLRCLLDTGASKTVLNSAASIAVGLGTKTTSDGPSLSGADGGTAASKIISAIDIEIGDARFQDMEIVVADLAIFNARGRGNQPQCVLGLSTLSNRDLIIDYPGQTLWIGDRKI